MVFKMIVWAISESYSIFLGLSPCMQEIYLLLNWFSPVTLSHVSLAVRPARRILKGRGKFFLLNPERIFDVQWTLPPDSFFLVFIAQDQAVQSFTSQTFWTLETHGDGVLYFIQSVHLNPIFIMNMCHCIFLDAIVGEEEICWDMRQINRRKK